MAELAGRFRLKRQLDYRTGGRVMIAVAVLAVAYTLTSVSEAQNANPVAAPIGLSSLGQRDQLSPLIITPVGADPIPVKGSDNKFHVFYELSVFNDAPRAATLTKVETLKASDSGVVISTLLHDEIVDRSLLTASYPVSPSPVVEIPPGRTLILVLDDVYATRDSIPAAVIHRVFASFGPISSGESKIASLYPDEVTAIGGLVTTSKLRPIVIGPPLTGDGWSAGAGCCPLNAHSNVVLPIGGRLNGGERFAVDWVRYDPLAKPVSRFIGDSLKNESYLAFGQPIIAVADGIVVSLVSNMPDIMPGAFPPDISLGHLTGNVIVLDIGDGVFVTYAHMKAASATVGIGEQVKKGQKIGEIGNSGNTLEPHLHFQLQRGPLTFTPDQVPWEIDKFNRPPDGVMTDPNGGPRTGQLPLDNTLSNFPALGH